MKTESFTTGTGQKLRVHTKADCRTPDKCPIHAPSIDWKTHFREDWGFMEVICPCGVGFPSPDDKSKNAMTHAFGCCGNDDCLKIWDEACK